MRLTVLVFLAATGWLATAVNAVPVSFDFDDSKPESDLLSQAEFTSKRLQRRAEDNASSASSSSSSSTTSTEKNKDTAVAASSTEPQTAQAREVS